MKREPEYYAERRAAKAGEPWHVRPWFTNRGRRSGYFVMAESDRNVSGCPLANCATRDGALAWVRLHNAELARRCQSLGASQGDGNSTN